jgi:hypothetical protein
MEQAQSCEHCSIQIHCRNLYVALKILEEEIRFTDRDDLESAFNILKQDITAAGYHYPSGSSFCTLSNNSLGSRALVARAEALLYELRRTVSISPA